MSPAFLPVTTKFIYYFEGALPFDVYLKRSEGKFTKIYNKNDQHDPEQIYRYEKKELNELYIDEVDKHLYGTFLCNLMDRYINGKSPVNKEQMLGVITTSLELTYEKIIHQNDELDSNLHWATQQIRTSLFLLEDDLTSALEIFKCLSADAQLLKHSYMVSIFSVLLAKKLGFSTERNLVNVGLGALLHDVGHSRVNPDLFKKTQLLSKEWDEIKDHPHLGLKIIDHVKGINSDVRSIIIQHHEYYNGRGYPNRLSNNQIFPPAKIVAIADGFCSFVSKASYRDTIFTPEQALTMMKDDIGHYDPSYLDTFEKAIFPKKIK
jgi:putative nucleotidyltransferase with HDIG domain